MDSPNLKAPCQEQRNPEHALTSDKERVSAPRPRAKPPPPSPAIQSGQRRSISCGPVSFARDCQGSAKATKLLLPFAVHIISSCPAFHGVLSGRSDLPSGRHHGSMSTSTPAKSSYQSCLDQYRESLLHVCLVYTVD
ncbi:hypothetical protein N7468_001388 [Penicillium chermesinum]|uniref:Uncharacterized protein n=1 Tax=Penicillium chermesinum TaxID=63820 RepID=A0A9W9PGQ8_9EURO|nr:uncharacterized protein N7468_001388 [Penicillium chermesinum]KAJ5246405.1 hypothetical protein N7468_001388 [Penicillium chermesinum]